MFQISGLYLPKQEKQLPKSANLLAVGEQKAQSSEFGTLRAQCRTYCISLYVGQNDFSFTNTQPLSTSMQSHFHLLQRPRDCPQSRTARAIERPLGDIQPGHDVAIRDILQVSVVQY